MKKTIVVVDIVGYWRVRMDFGPFIPLALAWRLTGLSKAEAYRRFENGRWRQVFAFGQCNVLESDLNQDGLLETHGALRREIEAASVRMKGSLVPGKMSGVNREEKNK